MREKFADLARDAIVITDNCVRGGVSFAAPGALELGYQPYVVVDAVGTVSELERQMALNRMTQAGAIVITTRQLLLEWSR